MYIYIYAYIIHIHTYIIKCKGGEFDFPVKHGGTKVFSDGYHFRGFNGGTMGYTPIHTPDRGYL